MPTLVPKDELLGYCERHKFIDSCHLGEQSQGDQFPSAIVQQKEEFYSAVTDPQIMGTETAKTAWSMPRFSPRSITKLVANAGKHFSQSHGSPVHEAQLAIFQGREVSAGLHLYTKSRRYVFGDT